MMVHMSYVAPTGSLWLSVAHYYSENLLLQSLLGSQCRCHADALSSSVPLQLCSTFFTALWPLWTKGVLGTEMYTWSCTASKPTALSFPCLCLCLCLCPQGAIAVHLLPCMFSPLLSSANCTNRTSDFWTHVTLESAAALMELLTSLPISFFTIAPISSACWRALWFLPFLSDPSPIIVYPCH